MIMKKTILTLLLVMVSCVATQAQMVGATNRQRGGFGTTSSDPEYRPTGYALHFEAAMPLALGVSYQLSPNVMLGGGIAYYPFTQEYRGYYQSSYGYWSDGYIFVQGAMPIYAQARLSTPRYRWGVFADFKLGYNIGSIDHKMDTSVDIEEPCLIFFGMQLGVNFKRLSLGAGFGWNPARVKFQHENGGGKYSAESYFCPSVSLSYDLPISVITSKLL